MSEDQTPINSKDKEYLEFVTKRLKSTNFQAKDKLQKMDELAEIIYVASNNYQKSKILKKSQIPPGKI